MKFSVITPNYNGAQFLEQSLQSVLRQRRDVEVQLIVVDGGSTDESLTILRRYEREIDLVIIGQDSGPANAINIGMQSATGDIVAWLNSDDVYMDGALLRVQAALKSAADNCVMCFGKCRIVDMNGRESRRFIRLFKECFFPFSSRFVYQCVNYISQPSLFVLNSSAKKAGPLREDLIAAWDYEWILRLWALGNATTLWGGPLSEFRVHPDSISTQSYKIQFREEWECAASDSGRLSIQTMIHFAFRNAIIVAYRMLNATSGT